MVSVEGVDENVIQVDIPEYGHLADALSAAEVHEIPVQYQDHHQFSSLVTQEGCVVRIGDVEVHERLASHRHL